MTNLWFEITATVSPGDVEVVSELMRAVTPGGVVVEEPVEVLGPEMGFRIRAGEPVLVRAYLPSSELGAVLTEDLRRSLEGSPAIELVARPLYEQDWAVSWREFFGAVETGGRMVIVPSWVEHEAQPGQIVLRLDPGQAFGTGHHETTRLCLRALDRLVEPGMAVLDVGTGSGILAIAAVKLGGESVDAVDVDPIAVEVAGRNCRENGVAEQVWLRTGVLDPERASRYDLAVANISTQANVPLARSFARVVKPGGALLLSGSLAEDAPKLQAAMEAEGFRFADMGIERDWCALEFVRG